MTRIILSARKAARSAAIAPVLLLAVGGAVATHQGVTPVGTRAALAQDDPWSAAANRLLRDDPWTVRAAALRDDPWAATARVKGDDPWV